MSKQKTHHYHIEIPLDLWQQLKTVAQQNKRVVKAEVVMALEARVREQLEKVK